MPRSRAERIRLIGVAAVVALLVFAPWACRDWRCSASPLPGQAVTNALSVTGFDIFAWNDPPTLARYLAVGPARLLEMRVEGLGHNLFTVLLLPGLPMSLIGLLALPWQGRGPGRPAGRDPRPRHVPGHEPGLPGRHDLGHVPPRRGPGPRAARAVRACWPWTPGSPGWAAGSAGRGRWPGSARCSASSGRCCSRSRSCRRSATGSRETAAHVRGAGTPHGGDRPPARRVGGTGHHGLPDLARRDAGRPRAGPARRVAERRPRPGRIQASPARGSSSSWATTTARWPGRPRHAGARTRRASRSSTSGRAAAGMAGSAWRTCGRSRSACP